MLNILLILLVILVLVLLGVALFPLVSTLGVVILICFLITGWLFAIAAFLCGETVLGIILLIIWLLLFWRN